MQLRLNGQSVKAIRVRSGLSLSGLARDIGRNKGYLSRLESGKGQPSPDTLVRIAQRLGVPIDAITYATEDDAA